MTTYQKLEKELIESPKTWLVTGAAGFIGSNLVEALLRLDQKVIGLDNLSTGYQRNVDCMRDIVSRQQLANYTFLPGDIRNKQDCDLACEGVDYVLNQAALGSVPRSVADPVTSNASNVDGFLNMLISARDAGVTRMVYASSSSVYGDHPDLPKIEENIGNPLSPYAATKRFNEIYADVFNRSYGFATVGLRYFNVFGARQDPDGAYAAVMPKWVASILRSEEISIFGDGETSRDFCYIKNVVQANLLAATAGEKAAGQVYNVAVGQRSTLNELYAAIRDGLRQRLPSLQQSEPLYKDFRVGDVRHSLADISKAKNLLGYEPTHTLEQGLELALDWYRADVGNTELAKSA